MDMFNYANDIDLYREWANVVVFDRFTAEYSRPYHCSFVGRRFHRRYAYSHDELLDMLGPLVVHHEPINSTFGVALGDYGYLVRSPDVEDIHAAARVIHELA
jgi:hypothetical protein